MPAACVAIARRRRLLLALGACLVAMAPAAVDAACVAAATTSAMQTAASACGVSTSELLTMSPADSFSSGTAAVRVQICMRAAGRCGQLLARCVGIACMCMGAMSIVPFSADAHLQLASPPNTPPPSHLPRSSLIFLAQFCNTTCVEAMADLHVALADCDESETQRKVAAVLRQQYECNPPSSSSSDSCEQLLFDYLFFLQSDAGRACSAQITAARLGEGGAGGGCFSGGLAADVDRPN